MLQTNRLTLRNLMPADTVTLFAYRNDSRCKRYQRYSNTEMDDLRQFVRDYSSCVFLSQETEQHYAITLNASAEMIGDLSIFFTEKDMCFTLGITIAPEFQRQGYAYELLSEVIVKLQKQYPGTDLIALIEKENVSSLSLFRKLNFIEECYAESIQSYIYAIYGQQD